MRRLLALAIVLAAGPAHAMGTYIDFDVLAWSDDGATALVRRTIAGSGYAGSGQMYVVISAGAAKPATFSFTTTLDLDRATEHVDVASCTRDADALKQLLAAKKVRNVIVARERCRSTRDVVTIGVVAERGAAMSWVAVPNARVASARETAAQELAKRAAPNDPADVAATTGELVLVAWGANGDSSAPAHLAAFAKHGDGYDRIVDDLRSLGSP